MEQQNGNVDYNELFIIEKDEFDGTTDVKLRHGMHGNPELDQFCDEIDTQKPEINVSVFINPEGNVSSISLQFVNHIFDQIDSYINIAEAKRAAYPNNALAQIPLLKATDKLLECLKKFSHLDLESPARGIIIIVDGTESIKLDADKIPTFSRTFSYFSIDKDVFLKLCNAHDLEFRIFKGVGDPIVIHGTNIEEANLISQFQILYNYLINRNMFPDAVQQFAIIQKHIQKQKSEIAHRMDLENSKGNRDLAIGIPLIPIGSLSTLVLTIVFGSEGGVLAAFLITIPLLFIGIMLIIFGARRKSGKMINRY